MHTTKRHLFNEFILCGLDPADVCVEPNEEQSVSLSSLRPELSGARYKSSVLLQIPFTAKDADDSIRKLCLPDDCRLSVDCSSTFPSFHAFVLVRENGQKEYGGSLVFQHKIPSEIVGRKEMGDWVFVTKSICLTSSFDLCDTTQRILAKLHLTNFSQQTTLNKTLLEKYVFMLLYETPMPDPGNALIFSLYQEQFYICSPDSNGFEFLDIDIRAIMQSLKPSLLLTVISHVLNECRVLIVGKDYSQLAKLAETLITLIYPFRWPHTYVPIVPVSMLTLLEAPFPFIMGLCCTGEKIEDSGVLSKYCVFNIDAKSVHCSKTIPPLPFAKALTQELETTLSIHNYHRSTSINFNEMKLSKTQSLSEIHEKIWASPGRRLLETKFYNILAREIFLNYIIQLLNDFTNYIIRPKDGESMTDWINERDELKNFSRNKYLNQQSKYTQSFMAMFTTTQIFASFIDSVICLKWNDADNDQNFFKLFNERRELLFDGLTEDDKTSGMMFHRTCSLIPDIEESFMNHLNEVVVIRIKHESSTTEMMMTTNNDKVIADYDDLAWSPMFSIKRKQGIFKYCQNQRLGKKYGMQMKRTSTPGLGRRKSIDSRFTNNVVIYKKLASECSMKSKLFFMESTYRFSHAGNDGFEMDESVDEEMVVSSIIDLLKRIWSHRPQTKNIPCHLWHHLQNYALLNGAIHGRNKSIDLRPGHALTWCVMRKKLNPFRAYDEPKIKTTWFLFELSDLIRTLDMLEPSEWDEDERANAFVRICMEYRVLKQCLATLLSEFDLLRSLYKQDAFLRQEQERESLLLNMEAAAFANYCCFTNHYEKLIIKYKVDVNSPHKTLGLNVAKPNLTIFGEISKSSPITFPNDAKVFNIRRSNVGEITLIFVDHDHKGRGNKFVVENIIIENSITKRIYRFNCRHLYRNYDYECSGRFVPAEQVGEDETRNPVFHAEFLDRNNEGFFAKESEINDVHNNIWSVLEEALAIFSGFEARHGAFLYLVLRNQGLCHRVQTVLSDRIKQNFTRTKHLWEIFVEFAESATSKHRLFGNKKEETKPNVLHNAITTIDKQFRNCDLNTRFQLWFCVAWSARKLSQWCLNLLVQCRNTKYFELDAFVNDQNCVTFFCNMMARFEELPYTPRFSVINELCLSLELE